MQTRLTLVTSRRNGGKTTTLERLVGEAKATSLAVGGVLALANPEKTWYRLLDLSSGKSMLALSEGIVQGAARIGRFSINQSAFDWANAEIERALQTANLIVFDEIGALELQGGGLAPSFCKALVCKNVDILAAVRDTNLEAVMKTFALDRGRPTLIQVGKEMKTNE